MEKPLPNKDSKVMLVNMIDAQLKVVDDAIMTLENKVMVQDFTYLRTILSEAKHEVLNANSLYDAKHAYEELSKRIVCFVTTFCKERFTDVTGVNV